MDVTVIVLVGVIVDRDVAEGVGVEEVVVVREDVLEVV